MKIKFLKSMLLCVIVIFMLPSCTAGVPSWLVGETTFDLDEETMSEIRDFVKATETDSANQGTVL